jgi:hypothetical protein
VCVRNQSDPHGRIGSRRRVARSAHSWPSVPVGRSATNRASR